MSITQKIITTLICLSMTACQNDVNTFSDDEVMNGDKEEEKELFEDPHHIHCPVGFIAIPPLEDYTFVPFCVAKYEMKKTASNTAVSHPTSKPWTRITRGDAIRACQDMGEGYDLISNDEWQTIARDIESVSINWSGGKVGEGSLNQGHGFVKASQEAFRNPAILPASADDKEGCVGIDNTVSNCQGLTWDPKRRTHLLSNTEIIWDMGGNVSEWVKDNNRVDYSEGARSPNDIDFISQITDLTYPASGSLSGGPVRTAKEQFGPQGYYFTSLNSDNYGGLGRVALSNYYAYEHFLKHRPPILEFHGGAIVRGDHLYSLMKEDLRSSNNDFSSNTQVNVHSDDATTGDATTIEISTHQNVVNYNIGLRFQVDYLEEILENMDPLTLMLLTANFRFSEVLRILSGQQDEATSQAGIFSTELHYPPSDFDTVRGFRCVYYPPD